MPVKYADELKDRAVERVVRAEADLDVANGANTQYVVVAWCNKTRLHPATGCRPPLEVHSEWINQSATEPAAAKETRIGASVKPAG
ncbi:hypothetical protein BLIN101_02334 [Brevibacterium linens]|uniref:Integrase catalytic domain-containing protein n=1 Tax=Brevibacterium linens TaxID=1703 RepID=A0A2H1JJ07_BRELN|nr:hypothetical protein BLIN101_02334 [Brevibacterium linens]